MAALSFKDICSPPSRHALPLCGLRLLAFGLPDNALMLAPCHLVIPFATCPSGESRQVFAGLNLPHLKQLLTQLTHSTWDTGSAHSFSPPHERVLAQRHGLAHPGAGGRDGLIPWGSLYAAQAAKSGLAGAGDGELDSTDTASTAWAVITPCHWSLQTNHIVLPDPALLQVQEDESRALLAAMQPYFAEDGITLRYERPDRWLAQGAVFRNLPTASPDRAIGRNIHDWLPQTPEGKNLRRLQNEMQMLLYTHPVNDARAARRQDAVNAFWISGTGALPSGAAPLHLGGVCLADGLRTAALCEDWAAWGQAWQQLDAGECATLLQTLATNKSATLTLCGERNAVTHRFESGHMFQRLCAKFSNPLGRVASIDKQGQP